MASAPAIFQRTIDSILQGIPNTCAYLDDIIVTGKSETEHLDTLNTVLERLEKVGIRLKRQKCEFLLPQIEYFGHLITAEGLKPTAEKIRAILDAPTPRDVQQLRAFLGVLNYYGKFFTEPSYASGPTLRAFTAVEEVDLGHCTSESLPRCQRPAPVSESAAPLRPRQRPCPLVRCVSVWSRRRTIAPTKRQDRATCCVRVALVNRR